MSRATISQGQGSEVRFRALVEQSPAAVVEIDLEGRVSYVNRRGRELYGLGLDAPLGFKWTDLIHPDDRAAADSPLELVHRVVSRDGVVRWVEGTSVPIHDEGGRATGRMAVAVDVTRRLEAERGANEARARLKLITDSMREAVYGINIRGECTFANRACLRLTGFDTLDDLLGKNMHDLIHHTGQAGEPLAAEDCKIFQAFRKGVGVTVDDEYFWRKDGTRFPIEYSSYPITREGVIEGAVVTFTDMTERQRVAAALEESQLQYRRIVETASEGIWVLDAAERTTFVNPAMARVLGYSPNEMVGRHAQEFVAPDQLSDYQRQRAVRLGPSRYERHFRCKDGASVWMSVSAQPICDARGEFAGWFGMLTDISERKVADDRRAELEGELRRATERLELAIRGSNVSIWEYDMPYGTLDDSRETLTNTWEQLGYDVPPASTALAIHPEDLPGLTAKIAAYLSGALPTFESEHRVRHKDGSYRWILRRGIATRDNAGRPVRFTGTGVDVTEMKRIELELQQATAAAESANRAKDDFLANVSHEIRTPMNAILGMTELALDTAPSEHQRQLLSTVRSAARNLLGIINDVLDFSKINAGKLALDPEDFSLRATVGDTLHALATRAERKGLELACHVAPDVPDWLRGDAGRLRQVLMNLVGNAIKFTERGEVAVRVSATPGSVDGAAALTFTVRDTGIGISLEKQKTIFRAFEQEDASTTRKYGGTGLGLTISAQLAALMDGEITVESEPGRGSTFRFTARFASGATTDGVGALAPGPRRPARTSTSAVRPERVALRVLVAEDNELNVAVLREVLSQGRHRVEFVGDGRAALRLALEGAFDLLLLDLHMPELDGFEVVDAIRRRERSTGAHLPIIALTARSSSRDRERALAAGMDDFLSKPIEVQALWTSIDRVLAGFSPAARRGSQLLDSKAILRVCGGHAETLDRLGAAFRQSLPAQLRAVQSALEVGDLVRLCEGAHKLYGTLAAFSTEAGALALKLEDMSACGDVEGCVGLVRQLEVTCADLVEATRSLTLDALML